MTWPCFLGSSLTLSLSLVSSLTGLHAVAPAGTFAVTLTLPGVPCPLPFPGGSAAAFGASPSPGHPTAASLPRLLSRAPDHLMAGLALWLPWSPLPGKQG